MAEYCGARFPDAARSMPDNLLYYDDNLDVLRRHVKDESVDLVYLDPPSFNRKPQACADVAWETSDAHACGLRLNEERDCTRPATEIKAFQDTWRWDPGAPGPSD